MEYKNGPLVSVMIPVYNGEKYIGETIESALSQTYKNIEVIVLNDGSTDSSESIVRSFARRDPRITYEYQANQGLSETRNRIIRKSGGEYIAFLDQDDVWMPQKLERQVTVLEQNRDVGLVFSDALLFNERGAVRQLYRQKKPASGHVFGQLLRDYYLHIHTVVVRKSALLSLGSWFDRRYKICEEADVFLRLAKHWNLQYVDEVLSKYRMHEESATFRARDLVPREYEMILRDLCLLHPEVPESYAKELSYARNIVQYRYALADWMHGDIHAARKRLIRLLFCDVRFLFPLGLSFLPYRSYEKVMKVIGRQTYNV